MTIALKSLADAPRSATRSSFKSTRSAARHQQCQAPEGALASRVTGVLFSAPSYPSIPCAIAHVWSALASTCVALRVPRALWFDLNAAANGLRVRLVAP